MSRRRALSGTHGASAAAPSLRCTSQARTPTRGSTLAGSTSPAVSRCSTCGPAGTDATKAVLGEIARLREEADGIVTVVLPEQFRKRSLLAAAQRAQFRLKLRLLVEPDVVVADVPAVTSERRPEGHVPDRLVVRVIAGDPDETTRSAVDYARQLHGVDELRAVHFGERSWDEDDLGLPVDDEPEQGRLGDSILDYVRRLTADPAAAVNVVLPERIQPGLKRLRGRRAIAIKRCLLFEPHVILTSVPHRDTT